MWYGRLNICEVLLSLACRKEEELRLLVPVGTIATCFFLLQVQDDWGTNTTSVPATSDWGGSNNWN